MTIPPGEYAVYSLETALDELAHLYATDPDAMEQVDANAERVFRCRLKLFNLVEQLPAPFGKMEAA